MTKRKLKPDAQILTHPLALLSPAVHRVASLYPQHLHLGLFPGLNRTWRHFHDATGLPIFSYRAYSPRTAYSEGARPWTIHNLIARDRKLGVGRLLRIYEHTCGGTVHHLVHSKIPRYNSLSERCGGTRLRLDHPSPCCLAALPDCPFRAPREPLARQIDALAVSR